jgi:predicted ATPase
MLWIVAELARQAAAKSQVILTTHSPQFLDAFDGEAPAVSVFEWVEGQTVIRTLSGEKLQKWLSDYSLGKFVFSGGAEAIS